jgi:hypothetical protein
MKRLLGIFLGTGLWLACAGLPGLPLWLEDASRSNPADPAAKVILPPTKTVPPTPVLATPTPTASPAASSATLTATSTQVVAASFTGTPTLTPPAPGSITDTPTQTPLLSDTFTLTSTPTPLLADSTTATPTLTEAAVGSPTFSPTPTNVASGPGLNVYARDQLNNPLAGAMVMLNNDTAGAVTTDAAGWASFPSAALPCDIHVFSPWSAGQALYSPKIFSYFGANANTVVVNNFQSVGAVNFGLVPLFTQMTMQAPMHYYYFGHFCFPNRYELYNFNFAPAAPATFYCPPNADLKFSVLELDFTSHVLGAYFTSLNTGSGNLTITAATSPTGYTSGNLDLNLAGISTWTMGTFYFSGGSGPQDLYFGGTGMSSPLNAAAHLTATAMAGAVFFQVQSIGMSVCANETRMGSTLTQFSSLTAGVDVLLAGLVTITQGPSGTTPVLSAVSALGWDAKAWTFGANNSYSSWYGCKQGAADGSTLNLTLPTVFPAVVPASYSFPVGQTFTATVTAMDSFNNFDPADIYGGLSGRGSNSQSTHNKQYTW